MWGAMLHSGQICMSTARVIVQRGAAEELIAQIKTLSASLTTSDLQQEESKSAKLGPLFTEGSAENVVSMIGEAQAAGAELLLGDLGRQGAVVGPHLVKGVKPGMRLWDREAFGPGRLFLLSRLDAFFEHRIVIAFAVVDTPEEAVDLANASDYTLSASLWTSDLYLAKRIAPLIRAGGPPLEVLFCWKLILRHRLHQRERAHVPQRKPRERCRARVRRSLILLGRC